MNKEIDILMGFSEDEIAELIGILEAYRLTICNDNEANDLQDRFMKALDKIVKS